MWWDHDFGWVGWPLMTIGMLGFWILVALLLVALQWNGRSAAHEGLDAREVLERRLANGEIDVEEYRQRIDALNRAPR